MGDALIHPHAAPFRFDADGEDAAVLLHGWTGSPAHLRPLGQELQAAGITAVAPLLAGHGTSVADMQSTTWRDWVGSAAAAAQDVASTGRRLHLVGLSMGGVIALLLAPVFEASSVATISAPMRVYEHRLRFSWLVRGSTRTQQRHPEPDVDPEVADFYRHYERSPVGTAADLFDLIRAARAHLGDVRCPALVIQSRADATVRPESARIIYDGVAAARKCLVWLDDARHVALVDAERDVIRDAVVDHIRSIA